MGNPRAGTALLAAGLLACLCACTGPAPGAGGSAAGTGTGGGQVTVFAASSLSDAMDTVEQDFDGAPLRLNVGSSTQLTSQVLAGAEADVILAADEQALAPLREAGVVVRETVIAENPMVLALAPGNPAGVSGLSDLADGSVQVAACAPAVPCGRAAQRVLDAAQVSLHGESREDDARSVLTKVATGQADAALVYLTDALAGEAQGVTRIDLDDPEPNRYPAALTVAGAQNPDAVTFYDWLAAGGADGALAAAGFQPVRDRGAGQP